MPSRNRVVSSAIWYTAANFLLKGINFFTIPLFTRLLTKEEYGEYNNFLSLLTIMGIMVSLSLESTIISARKDFRENLDTYVLSIMSLGVFSGIIWLVLVQAFAPVFSEVFSVSSRYLLAMSLYLVFFPITTTYQTWERFSFKYKGAVAVSVLLSVGIAAMSTSLTLILPNALDGVMFGRVLPAILIGVVIVIRIAVRVRKVDFRFWPYALKIAWPFIPHLLSMNLLGAVGKLFVTRMCGAEANALYSLANNCGMIVSILVTSLNSAFSPWLGDRLCEHDHDAIRAVSRPYVAGFAGIALIICLAAPEVLLILGGSSYMPAVSAIPPISLGCAFQFVYSMYVNVEQYEKKTLGMAIASISAAALNIVLNMLLIQHVGYLGAAYASLLSYVWLFLAHMFLVRRIGLLRVYDTRFVLCTMFIAAVLMLCSVMLYEMSFVRYSVIAAVLFFYVVLFCRFKDWTRGMFRHP